MGLTLALAPFVGLLLGGLRSPWAWTPFALALWLVALSGRVPVSSRALKVWAPWLAWLVVSALASAQLLKAPPVILRWASFALYLALAEDVWTERDRRLWLRALWVAAPILGAAALASGWGHLLSSGDGSQMTGFMPPYYNYTAFVEAAAFASLCAALLSDEPALEGVRAPAWAAAGLLAALIVASRSRGALVAAAAALALFAARRRRTPKAVVAAAVLAFALAGVLKLNKANVFKRPQIWRASLEAAAEHPAFGEGPGNYEAGFLRHNFRADFRAVDYLFSTPYAHSEPFQALTETGPIGLFLLLLCCARSVRPKNEAALAALAAMGVMCLYDNMTQLPALGLLMAGAAAAAGGPSKERIGATPRRAFASAGLVVALGAWLPAAYAASLRSDAFDEYDPEIRVDLLRKACALFPEDADLKNDVALSLLRTAPPRPDLALSELAEAARLSPTNALFLLERAELLESLGRLDEAERAARRAASLEPNCLQARLIVAASDARRGDVERASEGLAEVLRRRAALDRAGYGLDGYAGRICAFDQRRVAAVEKMLESPRKARK